MLFLFWDCLEPFYAVVSAFPQVYLGYLNDLFVYAVEDVFADDANFLYIYLTVFPRTCPQIYVNW